MNEEGMKMYLFLPQGGEHKKLNDSYIAVKQAYIADEIALKTERVAGYGVIFTSHLNTFEVNSKLRMKGAPYLLIELTGNITAETIAGFFPDTDIEELRALNLENLKDNAEWLEMELDKAVKNEDYMRAAEIRDKLNEKSKDEFEK